MPPVKFFFDTYGVREFYGKGEKELKHMFLESRYVKFLFTGVGFLLSGKKL